jgi:hypothetical protein
MSPYERTRGLIVVRTYPTPARKGVEVSCTAAISADGKRFLRLFPVPYRFLEPDKRFRKYQWIEVDAARASDARPESLKIRGDSIQIISSVEGWAARKDYVLPLRSPSLCDLKRRRDLNGYPTLGVFKPRTVTRLLIEPAEPRWTEAQLSILRQQDLFVAAPVQELEKVPFKFKYEFRCDDPECTTHVLSCTDWEMGESWRSWRDKYGDGWQAKFRQRYEAEMIGARDLHFFVGTVHQHPKEWIIVGLFYPPLSEEQHLFY